MTDKRIRLNAKQTAKGAWYFEATYENGEEIIRTSKNPNDIGDEEVTHIGKKLLDIINETQKAFRDDGKIIIEDKND